MNVDNNSIIKGDEIDLLQLVKTIWAGRKIIYYSIGIVLLIGIIYASTCPVKYKATATLLPSSEKKGGAMGGLSSLAGLAGINLGGLTDASGIAPDLYPRIIQSYPFKNELIHRKFNFESNPKSISIYDYLKLNSTESVTSTLIKYTVKLPFTIKDMLSSPKRSSESSLVLEVPIPVLDDNDLRSLGYVSNICKVEVDSKSGLIQVEVEMSEPILTAQVTIAIVEQLQKYVINYKTQQIREKMVFVENSFNEKKADFEKAQRLFLDYKDENRNVISERINIEYQRLSDSYDRAGAIYKTIAQQLEQVKLQVKEETPAFTVIEPVQLPREKSAPKRSMIYAFSVILGGFLGVIGVFFITFIPVLNRRFSKLIKV